MKSSTIVSIIMCSLLISSCATLQQMAEEQRKQQIKENCNTNGAYSNGMRDGLSEGVLPQKDFAAICPANNRAINDAYMDGFTQGLKARPQTVNINKTINDNTHKQ